MYDRKKQVIRQVIFVLLVTLIPGLGLGIPLIVNFIKDGGIQDNQAYSFVPEATIKEFSLSESSRTLDVVVNVNNPNTESFNFASATAEMWTSSDETNKISVNIGEDFSHKFSNLNLGNGVFYLEVFYASPIPGIYNPDLNDSEEGIIEDSILLRRQFSVPGYSQNPVKANFSNFEITDEEVGNVAFDFIVTPSSNMSLSSSSSIYLKDASGNVVQQKGVGSGLNEIQFNNIFELLPSDQKNFNIYYVLNYNSGSTGEVTISNYEFDSKINISNIKYNVDTSFISEENETGRGMKYTITLDPTSDITGFEDSELLISTIVFNKERNILMEGSVETTEVDLNSTPKVIELKRASVTASENFVTYLVMAFINNGNIYYIPTGNIVDITSTDNPTIGFNDVSNKKNDSPGDIMMVVLPTTFGLLLLVVLFYLLVNFNKDRIEKKQLAIIGEITDKERRKREKREKRKIEKEKKRNRKRIIEVDTKEGVKD